MKENEISKIIFDAGLRIHQALGPGLLESVYQECLYYELTELGLKVEKQKTLPLIYKDVQLETAYRVDLWVENKIIIEIKSVETISPLFVAQTLTYLKLSGCKLGLLINFNSLLFKDGYKRIVNGLEDC